MDVLDCRDPVRVEFEGEADAVFQECLQNVIGVGAVARSVEQSPSHTFIIAEQVDMSVCEHVRMHVQTHEDGKSF